MIKSSFASSSFLYFHLFIFPFLLPTAHLKEPSKGVVFEFPEYDYVESPKNVSFSSLNLYQKVGVQQINIIFSNSDGNRKSHGESGKLPVNRHQCAWV